MNIEIGQDSIFFVSFFFWLCILYISFCAISSEPAIYYSVHFFKCIVLVNALFLPDWNWQDVENLRRKFEYFFCFLLFVHCTRLIENCFLLLLLLVHWSVNCLTFLCFFSIVVLAFEYFLSYPYWQIYIKEKCTRLIIKEKQRIQYFWMIFKRKQ